MQTIEYEDVYKTVDMIQKNSLSFQGKVTITREKSSIVKFFWMSLIIQLQIKTIEIHWNHIKYSNRMGKHDFNMVPLLFSTECYKGMATTSNI